MGLTKLEIQQMLREMGVKFDADETYEALRERLQKRNHRLWLKSVEKVSSRVRVRKRKNALLSRSQINGTLAESTPSGTTEKKMKAAKASVSQKLSYRPRSIEKPAPGKPWKVAATGVQPFNRHKNVIASVFRRAKNCCEGCGFQSSDAHRQVELKPHHIQPLEQGGAHSIKNVVVLCHACREAIEKDPSLKAIKALKRKTRSTLYGGIKTVQKKSARVRRRFPHKKP